MHVLFPFTIQEYFMISSLGDHIEYTLFPSLCVGELILAIYSDEGLNPLIALQVGNAIAY